ncbi:MauE/DoxX family redox-associated membrane protein [Micromonospora echinofusca]|uniref:Methylamine utilisation protein MauE domain-containing protein n=1 Tax=Micromonospora echinofusca TaxID=47858 RepID=A0ABS3VYY2_MICEH|nr:MauE/DoxX family redox-associated membrane protein [Micromonospora echinofusca]MBO4209732.1 hypothetical protein [Micromonospora echinofusca]
MIELTAALQPLLIGAVLIWSARVKLIGRHAAVNARRSALAGPLGEQRAVTAYRLLGLVELVLGTLLVLPPASRAELVAATVLAAAFLGYLVYSRTTAPDASCGCLSAQRTPVTARSFVRAGVLLSGGLLATVVDPGHWLDAVTAAPAGSLVVVLVGAAVVVALSPEWDRAWLLPLRRLRARLTHPLAGGTGVPLLASVQQLQLSAAYRQVAALINSDVRDHWEEEDWRMVCYSARYQGRPATAVFAVPRSRHQPDEVRVALVDDLTGTSLAALGATVDTAGRRRPDHPVPGAGSATTGPAYAG